MAPKSDAAKPPTGCAHRACRPQRRERLDRVKETAGPPTPAHRTDSAFGQAERAEPTGPQASGVNAEWPRLGTRRSPRTRRRSAGTSGRHDRLLSVCDWRGRGWQYCSGRGNTRGSSTPDEWQAVNARSNECRHCALAGEAGPDLVTGPRSSHWPEARRWWSIVVASVH